tara:strand:- start:751 stop:1080 length:330 start_codon:yes stop_codon:yes gene_type:complete
MEIEQIALEIKKHLLLTFEADIEETWFTDDFEYDTEDIYAQGSYTITYKTVLDELEGVTIPEYKFEFIGFTVEVLISDYKEHYTATDRYILGMALDMLFEDTAKSIVES